MRTQDPAATAALLLAALLFVHAVWPAPPPQADCPHPGESGSSAGHTTAVRCEGGPALRGPARVLFGQPLDPNRADARTLETLPGIGPMRAAAIVAERERRPFASLEELRRVSGIGPVTWGRIVPWLGLPRAAGGAGLQQNR